MKWLMFGKLVLATCATGGFMKTILTSNWPLQMTANPLGIFEKSALRIISDVDDACNLEEWNYPAPTISE